MTREISIYPVLNGWLLKIGCQCVVFTDKQKMLSELSLYYESPNVVEKSYLASALNKTTPEDRPTVTGVDVASKIGAALAGSAYAPTTNGPFATSETIRR